MTTYKPRSDASTWLNAAAIFFLLFGIIAGLVIGNTSFGGDFFSAEATWFGWWMFGFGFACFVLFAALGALIDRLTSIRYLLSLQVGDGADTAKAAPVPPAATKAAPATIAERIKDAIVR